MYTCSVYVCDFRSDRKVEGKFDSVKLISKEMYTYCIRFARCWYINIVCWDCCMYGVLCMHA